MKKVLVFLLVFLMTISGTALAFNAEGYPICDEVVTITMSAPSPSTDWSEFSVIKGLERDLGIRLECTPYNPEAWDTQLTLMLAGGTLPDFLLISNNSVTLEEVSDLGSQGYFMPLNDLIDQYAPHITAMMEKVPDLRMYSTSADGNMYTVVGLQGSTISTVDRGFINRRWLENLNLEYPTSVEELKNVLIAFRDQDANGNGDPADEIPMSNFTVNNGSPNGLKSLMLNAFGLSANSQTNATCNYLLQEKDGKVYLGETTENYKAYLKYMNDLWNENLLDHDNFIQTDEEFSAKEAEDRIGAFWAWAPFVAAGKALDYDQNFYWLGGMSSEYQPERIVHVSSQVMAKPYYLINANSEYGAEIVRLMDYFFSDEGMLVGKYGYLDENYTMLNMEIPGLEDYAILKINQPEGYSSTEEYRNSAVTPAEALGPYVTAIGTYHAAAMVANAEQLDVLLPMYGWGILVMRDCLSNEAITKVPEFPVLMYSEEENSERASLYTDISLYIDTMHASFITGKTDIDAGWDEFIATLENMQLGRLLEIEQAAYDRLVG